MRTIGERQSGGIGKLESHEAASGRDKWSDIGKSEACEDLLIESFDR